MSSKGEDLVGILNAAMVAEYGTLWLLPRHMAQVKDEELKRQLEGIAEAELEHYEKTIRMIHALGGRLAEDLPNLRVHSGLREILETHVEGEKQAIALYARALEVAKEPGMRRELEQMRADEEGHQRLLQRALDRLQSRAE
jgi:rubrerythrin